MVRFIDVKPEDVPNFRTAHRGRVSYPILKAYLETGKPVAQLDRTGVQQSLMSLSSSLNAYIRNHELPIQLFQRGGEIFLARTDLDENGVPNEQHNDITKVKVNTVPAGTYGGDRDEDIPDLDDEDEHVKEIEAE
jgi:hypothetical protein